MLLLIFFAFLSGVVTILAPCIWPLLPIILSASITTKSHRRPLGITLGILISFTFFTLAISSLVRLFHFDPNVLRLVAVIVIGFLGLSMIIPSLTRLLEGAVSRLTSFSNQSGKAPRNDFWGGLVTGVSLGIVWSPCAGPILASIATLAATGQVTFNVILVTVAYSLGASIPLFIFAYGGQQVFTRTRFISSKTGAIQRVFGVIMILTAVAIFTNYDQYLQSQLLNMFPQINSSFNSFEQSGAVQQQLNVLKGKEQTMPNTSGLFNTNSPAPDFVGITHWLNTNNPLSISDLKGKVVLVDFWTYTCINCIRTLPHVTAWYDKYKDQGFVVIGVHTPEFAFEHNTQNVEAAIKRYNIHYPVAQDNNYATWNNYNNQYWPAEYLIDANGSVRRTHFGEGEYDQTEKAIQELLKGNGKTVTSKLEDIADQTPTENISPESYVGSDRMEFEYPSGALGGGSQTFILQSNIPQDSFDFGGMWDIEPDHATAQKNAVLEYHFNADKVFLVMNPGSDNKPKKVKVYLDGQLVKDFGGSDVVNGVITVDSDRLYNLIDMKNQPGSHVLRLEFVDPGTQSFAFTFG